MYGQQIVQSSQQQQSQQGGNQIPFNSIIQAKYSSGGLLLAANNLTPDLDVLLVAAPDVSSSIRSIADSSNSSSSQSPNRPFTEVASTIEVPGRTWDMAEITSQPLISTTGGTSLNELATQGTQKRREWVILTNMGANVVSRQRPIDTLLDVLEAMGMNGNGHGEIGVFFESSVVFFLFPFCFRPRADTLSMIVRRYGRDQSCAMLLAIAAGNSQLSLNESASAPQVGGMSGFQVSNSRNSSTSLADQAKGLFFEGGGRPISIDRGGYGSQSRLVSRFFFGRN